MTELAECGCPKVFPLPEYMKVGAEVTCHHEHDLHLPDSLKKEMATLWDFDPIDPSEVKIVVTKGTKGTITSLDDHYVTVEFRTLDQRFEGPWFNKLLRGDFAWFWCGTSEDALSRMMGFPHAGNLPPPP